jgi:hypothetical protein
MGWLTTAVLGVTLVLAVTVATAVTLVLAMLWIRARRSSASERESLAQRASPPSVALQPGAEAAPELRRLIPTAEFEADVSQWFRRELSGQTVTFHRSEHGKELLLQCTHLNAHPDKSAREWLDLALETMQRPPLRATVLDDSKVGGCEVSTAHLVGGEFPAFVAIVRGVEGAVLMTVVPSPSPVPPEVFSEVLNSVRTVAELRS